MDVQGASANGRNDEERWRDGGGETERRRRATEGTKGRRREGRCLIGRQERGANGNGPNMRAEGERGWAGLGWLSSVLALPTAAALPPSPPARSSAGPYGRRASLGSVAVGSLDSSN